MKLPFLCLALYLPLALTAGPLIEFESTEVRVEATAEQDEVPVTFKFKAKGDAPLKISDIHVGCKCLHASVQKEEYKPGESGEVNTVMELGAFEGEVSKYVTLVTNDTQTPQILRAIVRVPNVISFDPPVTSWVVGSPATPKKILVKVEHKDPINILKLSSTRPNFTPEIKVIKAGREYEITLTPESTETPALGLLTVETDCKITKYAKRQTFFNIVRTAPIGSKLPPQEKKAP